MWSSNQINSQILWRATPIKRAKRVIFLPCQTIWHHLIKGYDSLQCNLTVVQFLNHQRWLGILIVASEDVPRQFVMSLKGSRESHFIGCLHTHQILLQMHHWDPLSHTGAKGKFWLRQENNDKCGLYKEETKRTAYGYVAVIHSRRSQTHSHLTSRIRVLHRHTTSLLLLSQKSGQYEYIYKKIGCSSAGEDEVTITHKENPEQ